jgi:hypothetical protein
MLCLRKIINGMEALQRQGEHAWNISLQEHHVIISGCLKEGVLVERGGIPLLAAPGPLPRQQIRSVSLPTGDLVLDLMFPLSGPIRGVAVSRPCPPCPLFSPSLPISLSSRPSKTSLAEIAYHKYHSDASLTAFVQPVLRNYGHAEGYHRALASPSLPSQAQALPSRFHVHVDLLLFLHDKSTVRRTARVVPRITCLSGDNDELLTPPRPGVRTKRNLGYKISVQGIHTGIRTPSSSSSSC